MTNRKSPTIFLYAMTFSEQFLEEIENYLTESGMDPTTFGKSAMNDPRFVFDIRNGRSPSGRTVDKVRAWVRDHPVSEGAAA